MISVVVIDDNKPLADRIACTIAWKELGCEVVAVEYNGFQGKKAILQYLPELIISDIRMPGLDGLEMVELVREHIPASKVIFISAYEEFQLAYRAIKLNAFDYLTKPFTQAELVRTVQRAVSALKEAAAPDAPRTEETGEKKTVAARALEYLEKHIGDRLTVADLAERFGLSPNHLSRLILQETGSHFGELATKMRIEKAKALLRSGDFKVAEIGEMVGYQTYLSFYKAFIRSEGIAPTEYGKTPDSKG